MLSVHPAFHCRRVYFQNFGKRSIEIAFLIDKSAELRRQLCVRSIIDAFVKSVEIYQVAANQINEIIEFIGIFQIHLGNLPVDLRPVG